jgi:hypothetical protein
MDTQAAATLVHGILLNYGLPSSNDSESIHPARQTDSARARQLAPPSASIRGAHDGRRLAPPAFDSTQHAFDVPGQYSTPINPTDANLIDRNPPPEALQAFLARQ